MDEPTSALLTDLYQLNMMQAYLDHGDTGTAVFEFFVRKLPARRGFLMAAGLEQALDYLENLRFSPEEIDWLAQTGRFGKDLLDQLARFRFTGDVHAMPEGTAFFADEPILRVTAPLPQAQLVETRLINLLHFQSLIASKAARMLLAAAGKAAGRFRLAPRARRRGRACWRRARAISPDLPAPPPCWPASASAFRSSAPWRTRSSRRTTTRPPRSSISHARGRTNLTLLIDTYDTEAAARKVVALAPRLKADGITIRAVRSTAAI